jgi:hypothetical protein
MTAGQAAAGAAAVRNFRARWLQNRSPGCPAGWQLARLHVYASPRTG